MSSNLNKIFWLLLNIVQTVLIVMLFASFSLVAILILVFSKRISFWFSRVIWSRFVLLVAGAKVKVEGIENIKNASESFILCANHQSHFDIVVMINQTPFDLYFIGKKELQKIPFLGWYMTMSGMIFIDRSSRADAMISMRRAGELIRKGKHVITFPEGTRSKDKEIGIFKKGTFVIAQGGEVDILPVAIKGSFDVNPPKRFRLRPGVITISYGKIIKASSFKEKTPIEIANRTREEVVKLYESI